MGKTLADLQSNISISAQNAVTGDIEFCTGYTGFSGDIGEQAGWYIALKIDTSTTEGALEGATITATYHNRTVTLDSDRIIIVRLAEGEDSITFTANKEGYTEGRLTLDLSGLDKEALTQNILYTASLTNGVTVSPLQFGESKTITGEVPWNTTDNANTFNISMRPFEMVAPGTPWSIAFNGVELAEGEFSTITPESGSPYSFATAKLTITQEMISAQSPYLVVTVRPDSADPVGAFYSSMNIGGLTLAPDPRPKVNITSDTQGITISPSSYATSKTATGQVPYDTTTQQNILSVALTTSGTLPTGPYTIEVFAQGDVMQQPIWYVAGASTIPQSIPIPLTSSNVGTGKYITVNISGANDPEFNIITIDTSALTLEAAPVDVSYLLDTQIHLGSKNQVLSNLGINDTLLTNASKDLTLSFDIGNQTYGGTGTNAFKSSYYNEGVTGLTNGNYSLFYVTRPNNAPNTMKIEYKNPTDSDYIEIDFTSGDTQYKLIPMQWNNARGATYLKIYDTRDLTKIIEFNFSANSYFKVHSPNQLFTVTVPPAGTVYGNKTIEDIQSNIVLSRLHGTDANDEATYYSTKKNNSGENWGGNFLCLENATNSPTSKYVQNWTYNDTTMADGNYLILRFYKNDSSVFIAGRNSPNTGWTKDTDTSKQYMDLILKNLSDIGPSANYYVSIAGGNSGGYTGSAYPYTTFYLWQRSSGELVLESAPT